MKKYILILSLISFCILSCEKINTNFDEDIEINACGVTSFKQLTWAQKLISGQGSCENIYSGAKLTMYNYKSEQVFYFENSASSVGICTRAVYNCSGISIIQVNDETDSWQDFEKNRTNEKLLWSKK